MKEPGLVLTADWRPANRRVEGARIAEAIKKAQQDGISRSWLARAAIQTWLEREDYLQPKAKP